MQHPPLPTPFSNLKQEVSQPWLRWFGLIPNLDLGVVNVKNFGAVGDGVHDDTVAIQKAITEASVSPKKTVILPPGIYAISSMINIDSTGVKLKGFGGTWTATLKCTAAGAGVKIYNASGTIYQVGIESIYINGNSTATTGLTINDASECILRDVIIINPVTNGVLLQGAVGGNNFWNVAINGPVNGLNIQGQAHDMFVGCNIYDTTNAVLFSGTTYGMRFIGTYFETFDTCFLFDHTAAHLISYGIESQNCYFLSTNGGGGFAARIAKSLTANNTYNGKIFGMIIRDAFISMSAAAYFFEVDWDNNVGGGDSRFHANFKDNFAQLYTNTTAWFNHDVALDTAEYIRVEIAGCLHSGAALPYGVQRGTHSKTGIGTLANDATPSVLGPDRWLTGGTTTITDLDDGVTGDIKTIIAEHAITITDGTNIFLAGSANFDMAATDTLTLVCKADNKWYEIGRSDNT